MIPELRSLGGKLVGGHTIRYQLRRPRINLDWHQPHSSDEGLRERNCIRVHAEGMKSTWSSPKYRSDNTWGRMQLFKKGGDGPLSIFLVADAEMPFVTKPAGV